ncbi:hypothetical protein UPYG_G00255420 [Umbra pygmaea]|uniref:Ig-like domain-containing protein n=1 Tax=Umbra pygmaea TaxID=75934 RepID=A0ABD0W8C3_UMBPY
MLTDWREINMADVHHSSLGLVVMVLFLLIGVSGDTVSLFTTVGGLVSLPCNNVVYSNCSSTTWIYNRNGSQGVIEEVEHGKIKNDSQRAGKLKVGSDCSLHVSDVSVEDAGLYTCRQFLTENGPQHGGDADVHLSVLTMFSSPPVTYITSDTPVTLRCFLYTYNGAGRCFPGVNQDVSLLWVDEAGSEQQRDSRVQVTQRSSCDITLTVTLQREDNNRKWTCQLINNGNKETSIDYTFTVPGSTASMTEPDLSATSPSSTASTPSDLTLMILSVVVVVTVCVIAAVIIVHRRRTKMENPVDDSLVNNKDLGLTAVNYSSTPANKEKTQPADSITYASIGHFNQNPPQRVDVHGEDAVTYASVMTASDRGREPDNPADHSSLYATVNKPQEAKTST